jgi:hypothetical protein
MLSFISLNLPRAASNTLLGILGCLSCRCDYMLAPTYYFLVHYCSGCGIRLVSVPWDSDPIPQLHSSFLVPADPARADGPKIAPSPFGPPPQKLDAATLRNFAERFADWSPSIVLEIKHKSSSLTLPVAAINTTAENTGYEISWPGFPSHTHKGFASPIEYKPANPMSTVTSGEQSNSKIPAQATGAATSMSMSLAAWNPDDSTPHIRVSAFAASTETEEITHALTGPELATAQVFPTSKDFILHTPRRQTPLVLEEDTPTSRYISHRSGLPGKTSPSAGFMVWRSSSWGPMTWTVRKIRVNDMKKPSRCLVLLDAYDRLVGVMGESNFKKEGVAVRLSLYGDGNGLPQVLVAEILASFAALAYVVWNYEQLGVADPELAGFVSGALDVAGAATGLAGV